MPSHNAFIRLGSTPKHFLADPRLAARLLGLDDERLLQGANVGALGPQHGSILGHLLWLKSHLGAELVDTVVLYAGSAAYCRPDGVAVVPAALLGA